VLREGVALGTRAREACDGRNLADRDFCRQFIFRGARLKLFELESHLIDKPGRSLRPWAVKLALQLGDSELLMRDHGKVGGGSGSRNGKFSRPGIAFRDYILHPGALDHQRRFQRVNVVRQGCRISIHDRD
jgi:hypothetical protein